MTDAKETNGGGVLQTTNEEQPYLSSDHSAMSLAFLARKSSNVYSENVTAEENLSPSGIIEIGPDRFAIHEHKPSKTLVVFSLCFIGLC